MKNKGLAAMLDGLLAYSVAFLSVGLISLLLINTPESDLKKTYTLNIWAEDLADAIGMSLVNESDTSVNWLSNTSDAIRQKLNDSLSGISEAKNMSILVTIGDEQVFHFGNISRESTVATATRVLLEVDSSHEFTGDLVPLKVRLGV